MSDETRQRQLEALWQHVTGIIKKQIVNPTLWIAMEKAKPLVLENNLLVLGIPGPDYHLATNLEQIGPKTTIEKQLSAAARGEMHYRIIQGDTYTDWVDLKERERIAAEMSAQPHHRRGREHAEIFVQAATNWEDALTQSHRAFQTLSMKSIPQARAQYILDVLPLVYETEMKIAPTGKTDMDERGLGRVLEKIAQLAETDPTAVAMEYLRYRQSRQGAPAVDGSHVAEPDQQSESGQVAESCETAGGGQA